MGNYKSSGTSVLTMVFEQYIEDSITDEQVSRILEPILRLIEQGAFDRPRHILEWGSLIWTRPVELLFKKRVN